MLQSIIVFVFFALLVRGFLYRNTPQVGGKFGPIRTTAPPQAAASGFSRIYTRAVTLFVATDASRFPTLKAFLRDGTVQQPVVMRIYRVAGCKAEIEIPDRIADYERIDASQALALLRELPDLRRVRRLHLSDESSFLDPWVRKVRDDEFYHLGHATNFSLIVLYKPDRRLGQLLGTTLLHEWLHLVAFASTIQVWRFKRANAIEPLSPLAFEPLNFGDRNTGVYEAWCDLGEKLLGYDERTARQAALVSPVHAIILWRCVERMLRRTPLPLRSTRFDELMKRADFMRAEVEPKARALRAKQAF
ncbi:MAG: hypothetical protein E7813_09140 [Bradyrhizobium sp.]|nr:MAG: hypothetical protein E7813_09140 [Bradyrhizobium sp.]